MLCCTRRMRKLGSFNGQFHTICQAINAFSSKSDSGAAAAAATASARPPPPPLQALQFLRAGRAPPPATVTLTLRLPVRQKFHTSAQTATHDGPYSSTSASSTSSTSTSTSTSETQSHQPLRRGARLPTNYSTTEPHSADNVIFSNIPKDQHKFVSMVMYGENRGEAVTQVDLPEAATKAASEGDFDVQLHHFKAFEHESTPPRRVRFGVTQCQIPLPTTAPIEDQYQALEDRHVEMAEAAAAAGCNILCFQETWHMPFAFCTREKLPWTAFAQTVDTGKAIAACRDLARRTNMVIVSPILERDAKHADTIWNTAVVISNSGEIIGQHRKNHIPRVTDFNESTYYMEGQDGWPVFETEFGKIAVNICYGRHHYLNWMAFGLNGAEIVFNPSATVGSLSEPMWSIEARAAAIQNNYFVAANNRVGTEVFEHEFTSGDGKPAHHDFGHFYGSSYIAGPDASRSRGLSRTRDGVIIADVDLNLNRQLKDKWTFQMTARHADYAKLLTKFSKPDFEPQVIRDPRLDTK
jgi:beta-ureidopropionase